jgi:hypothetical protein
MKNLGMKSYLEPLESKTYLARCPLARIPQQARLQQGRDIIVLVPFANVPQTLVLLPKEQTYDTLIVEGARTWDVDLVHTIFSEEVALTIIQILISRHSDYVFISWMHTQFDLYKFCLDTLYHDKKDLCTTEFT